MCGIILDLSRYEDPHAMQSKKKVLNIDIIDIDGSDVNRILFYGNEAIQYERFMFRWS